MKNNNTDTISASKLKAGTLDDKVAKRIKVYEFDNKSGGYKEKLANLTESQSYMALEFEKMQEEMNRLKMEMEDVQRNVEYQTVEQHYLLADIKCREEKNINRILWFVATYCGGQLLAEIAKVILHI